MSMTTKTKQRELSQIPDGAQEPFSLATIVEPAEICRLAWWFLQVFPSDESGIGDLYIDAVINPEAPAWAADWGVRVVRNMFYQRIHYGPEDGPKWCVTPSPISDVRIGAIGGISSGSVTSLKDMRRAEREPWQRTTYDLPPATVYARHRKLVAKTVRHARDAVEEMLRQADAQPEHVQELDAYLSVAYAHVRPVQAVVAADTTPTPAQLQEAFLQITAPLVADTAEDGDVDEETETTSGPDTALPAYLAELLLFAAAT